jgi:hypothetical protein
MADASFNFEISLSVLNHLGRNLYRNFITVVGEAISNAWDADANNVWITIDDERSSFTIKDDGCGMTADDFQQKFLKIGYSKRKDGSKKTPKGRPFIGAKGIGKLALLSCADRVSILSKTATSNYVGGTIDNSRLDTAITSDLTPEQYPLEAVDANGLKGEIEGHKHGTIIAFQGTKAHIKNSISNLKKLLAMYFRFSLVDKDFAIHVNGAAVTIDDLDDLISNTQFWWSINKSNDPLIKIFPKTKGMPVSVVSDLTISGFLATVIKPRNLKISGTDERATVDLFVNGRLREKNIIRHIPTQRILESYLYGQIHFDEMDKPGTENDPFTSSREGIKEEDANFQLLLNYLKSKLIPQVLDEWDKFRLRKGEDGDEENTERASPRQRKVKSLFHEAKADYEPKEKSKQRDQVDKWLDDLAPDAEFNISSYVDCFLSENLIRKFIVGKRIKSSKRADKEIEQWRKTEAKRLKEANVSFSVRRDKGGLSYLDMDIMAHMIDGKKSTATDASLVRDAISYKPVRNVVGHTGLLTKTAKNHLNTTFENVKGRVRKILSGDK